MKIQQKKYSSVCGWEIIKDDGMSPWDVDLVLAFGSTGSLKNETIYNSMREQYPNAVILSGSTAGEILGKEVADNSVSLTAINFNKIHLQPIRANIHDFSGNSFQAGKFIASSLGAEGLKSVLIISDGRVVNGSELVSGVENYLPNGVVVTGGLAGDGARFQKTLVGLNEPPSEGKIAALGFYGGEFTVTSGYCGGWEPYGRKRLITRSEANVLYELDGQPALDLYKNYLGEFARELPSSALYFPLNVQLENGNSFVRTVLSVNEKQRSVTFAGNLPMGAQARLMQTSSERLIEAACCAATTSSKTLLRSPDLAILISCIGRKLILGPRTNEEIKVIKNVFGEKTAITGFYSYGEISPTPLKCHQLHNQTMTITTLTEN